MDYKSLKKITVFKMEAIDVAKNSSEAHNEEMLIGFFDSQEMCACVENDYKTLPGFSLPSCRFVITPYTLYLPENEKLEQVFYAQRVFNEYTEEEVVTEIGLFSSCEEAERGICRALFDHFFNAQGSAMNVESIYVSMHIINKREWQEGFDQYNY